MFLPLVHLTDHLNVLVVGGGEVAYRKAKDLLDAGATVEIISPGCQPELKDLISQYDIIWRQRKYKPGDIHGFGLVIAATDDSELNRQVSREAHEAGIPVNVVDIPELCSVFFPAVVRRDSLLLAVSTGGDAPFFARETKKRLVEWLDKGSWELRAKWAKVIRRFAIDTIRQPEKRETVFARFMETSVTDLENWDFTHPPEDLWHSWIDKNE